MRTNDLKKILKCLKVASSGITLQEKLVKIEFASNMAFFSMQGSNAAGTFKIEGDFDAGEGFVEIEALAQIVNQCSEEDIILKFDQKKDLLIIRFARSRFKLSLVNHKFEEINQKFDNEPVGVTPGAILAATKQVSSWCNPSSSYDSERGIYTNEGFVFIGNSNRIAAYEADPFGDTFFFYQTLVRFIEEVDTMMEITTNENFIRLQANNFWFIFDIKRKTQIPDVSGFIQMEVADSIDMTAGQLKDLAGGTSVVRGETLKIQNIEEGILFTCKGTTSDYKSIIPCAVESDFCFVLDSKLFVNAVKTVLLDKDVQGVKFEVFADKTNPGFKIVSGPFTQLISTKNAERDE